MKQLLKIPNIKIAIINYLKTDKGKKALKDYLYANECLDYNLIEELRNFPQK